jgi:hypothetical protein
VYDVELVETCGHGGFDFKRQQKTLKPCPPWRILHTSAAPDGQEKSTAKCFLVFLPGLSVKKMFGKHF